MIRRAQLSKNAVKNEDILARGHLTLDTKRYTASWKGSPLTLTITEFLLLNSLVRYPGHIKTREMLIDEVYPHNTYVSDRTIDTHIKRLRKKFAECDPECNLLETVYGMGYRYKG